MGDLDAEMMAKALEAGRRGDPSPNPHVGCVVAQGKEIVGTGHHETAGEDHAEITALKEAGERAKGATLYVTLEPCAHQGRTAPCVDAIIEAGVKRVVIGCKDPNPHVEGGGQGLLEQAGIEVSLGILEGEAKQLIKPWEKYITRGSTYLALKLATSLDGRTATRTGASKWITGSDSRAKVHLLRTQLDAVMVGINTVVADDPRLTVRDVPGRNPVRVVIDSKLRFPLDSQLAQTADEIPTCVITTPEAPEEAALALSDLHVSVIRVPAGTDGRVDMTKALEALAAREVVSVLVLRRRVTRSEAPTRSSEVAPISASALARSEMVGVWDCGALPSTGELASSLPTASAERPANSASSAMASACFWRPLAASCPMIEAMRSRSAVAPAVVPSARAALTAASCAC